MNSVFNIPQVVGIVIGLLLAVLTDRMVRGTRARRLMFAVAVFILAAVTIIATMISILK